LGCQSACGLFFSVSKRKRIINQQKKEAVRKGGDSIFVTKFYMVYWLVMLNEVCHPERSEGTRF
jgi:hypothetical protein